MPVYSPPKSCHFSVRSWFLPALAFAAAVVDLSAQNASLSGLANAEADRRAALVSDAMAQVREGGLLYNAGKYQQAADVFSGAYSSLPVSPLTETARAHARRGFAAAACARARELLAEGRHREAETLLKAVTSSDMDPQNAEARRLLQDMADPDRYPPALTPEHMAAARQVAGLLRQADSQLELGDYDAANQTYTQVLRIDPYNSAARRGRERTEQHKARYFEAAKDHHKARMLNMVNAAWEDGIPPTLDQLGAYSDTTQDSLRSAAGNREKIARKLREMTVPKVDFSGASFEEVIEFLRIRSRDLDPEGRGVDFVLALPPETVARPIDLTLVNIPMEELVRYVSEKAGAAFKIEEFAVKFVSLTEQAGDLFLKTYRVPPGFIETAAADAAPAPADPFAAAAPGAGGLSIRRLGAREFLESRGVSFPEGATASYNKTSNLLVMRNTAANHEIVDMLVEQAANSAPKQALISIKWIELNQTNLRELGFDWLLGQFNLPGSNGVFGGGGTTGTAQTADDLAANFPMRFPGTDIPIGQFPMTAGVRSSGEILGRPTLDSLLGENLANLQVDSRSPGQFALSGVLSDPQFQVVARALNQKKGVDVLSVPSIVAKGGQRASIILAREFIYPTEFDPPEIPQQFGNVGGRRGRGGSIVTEIPITPTTPTTFEMRRLGAVIEMEPIISENGKEVELLIQPEFTEFEGFIDYASDIEFPRDPGGNPQDVQRVDNRIIQPIFRTNRVNTSVRIYDGSTVVLGGVVQDRRVKVDDKVPVIGDIPLIGRLWKSKVELSESKSFVVFVSVRVLDPSGQPVNPIAGQP